ncbi:MAG: hypothetical protein WCF16_08675 [Alphaproteobacteria bacterium]
MSHGILRASTAALLAAAAMFASLSLPRTAAAEEQSPVAELSPGEGTRTANIPDFRFGVAAVRFYGTNVILTKLGSTHVRVMGRIRQLRCSEWHTGDLDVVLYNGDTVVAEIPKVYTMGDGCHSCEDRGDVQFYAGFKDAAAFAQATGVQLVSHNFKVCAPK